jgi:hypothetical protein
VSRVVGRTLAARHRRELAPRRRAASAMAVARRIFESEA